MKLILEGPDNAGKTSLANIIRREMPYILYHHPGGRPANAQAEQDCLDDQVKMFKEWDSILMDRCTAISQQIYSPSEERQTFRDFGLTELIDAGVLFVYCRPSTDWLMSFENFTWREGETEEFKQEIISKQHVYIERYDELMRLVPHVHYDYRSEEAPNLIKHLVYAARGNDTSLQLLNSLRSFEVPNARNPR